MISARNLKIRILRLLDWIPDETMVKIQYRLKTGRSLDLRNPKRFSEKLQCYKLYYRNPVMAKCADKYEVREYVKEKGLERILIRCLGIYDDPREIDFDSLPDSFVLKDTLGMGGNSVIVVKDKKSADMDEIRTELARWVSYPVRSKNPGREWVYDSKKHRIIAEEYVKPDNEAAGLVDYKFFCSYGKVKFMYVIAYRTMGHGAALGIFDGDFNRIGAQRADERILDDSIKKPSNFEELYRTAETLSADFPESRIDLYDEGGKALFGEITFFDGSGYMKFDPDSFDMTAGEWFDCEDWVKK